MLKSLTGSSPLVGPKISVFGPKIFVALGETVHFQPSERLSTFRFWVTVLFVKKKTRPTRQKVFPHPTVGAPSASNSPSALIAQALRGGRLVWVLKKVVLMCDGKSLAQHMLLAPKGAFIANTCPGIHFGTNWGLFSDNLGTRGLVGSRGSTWWHSASSWGPLGDQLMTNWSPIWQ